MVVQRQDATPLLFVFGTNDYQPCRWCLLGLCLPLAIIFVGGLWRRSSFHHHHLRSVWVMVVVTLHVLLISREDRMVNHSKKIQKWNHAAIKRLSFSRSRALCRRGATMVFLELLIIPILMTTIHTS